MKSCTIILIHQFPPDLGLNTIWVVEEWGVGVELQWQFNDSCYDVTSVELEVTGDLKESIYTNSNGTSIRLEDLLPMHQYTITAYVIYDSGRRSDGATVEFRTDSVLCKLSLVHQPR